MTNEYTPWVETKETELGYYKRRFLEESARVEELEAESVALRAQVDSYHAALDAQRRELCETLGLDPHETPWQHAQRAVAALEDRVMRVQDECAGHWHEADQRVEELEGALSALCRRVSDAEGRLMRGEHRPCAVAGSLASAVMLARAVLGEE